MNKFDWLASESAPEGFPMRIIEGNFYDSKGGSLYIPTKAGIHHGWGTAVSTHIVGADKKPLPNRFDILCFSYAENVFYGGEFDLPYEHILALFKSKYYSPRTAEDATFRKLVAGVTPGGYVTVWAVGIGRQIEVFKGQLDKIDVPWTRVLDNPNVSREDYIESSLKEALSDVQYQQIKQGKIPFGIWEKYAQRFPWKPKVIGLDSPDLIRDIEFFNGERDYYSLDHGNDWNDREHTIPQKLTFKWKADGLSAVKATFTFDFDDISRAFNEIKQQTQAPFYLTFDIQRQKNGRIAYAINLTSEDIIVPLRKVGIEH
ncbi:DUF2931 family protein [Aliikangiella coralliicola]|nr:DUF2931 family protein [Aliikangiella coralliicola]